jgi:hypothetical protein
MYPCSIFADTISAPNDTDNGTENSYRQSIVGGNVVTDKNSAEYRHTIRFLNSGIIATQGVPAGYEGKKLSWRCSGTLISERLAVTAAHCFPKGFFMDDPNKPGTPLFVPFEKVTGEVYFKRNSREDTANGLSIQKFVAHPEFRDNWMYTTKDSWNPQNSIFDIAVALLSANAPPEKSPATMIVATQKIAINDNLILAGYGKTGGDNEIEMPVLKSVSVPFRALLNNKTDMYVGEGDVETPNKLSNPHGACSGDSGGPAYLPTLQGYSLAGVIVRGPDTQNGGCLSSVTILTDVRAYANWITATSKKLLE